MDNNFFFVHFEIPIFSTHPLPRPAGRCDSCNLVKVLYLQQKLLVVMLQCNLVDNNLYLNQQELKP